MAHTRTVERAIIVQPEQHALLVLVKNAKGAPEMALLDVALWVDGAPAECTQDVRSEAVLWDCAGEQGGNRHWQLWVGAKIMTSVTLRRHTSVVMKKEIRLVEWLSD